MSDARSFGSFEIPAGHREARSFGSFEIPAGNRISTFEIQDDDDHDSRKRHSLPDRMSLLQRRDDGSLEYDRMEVGMSHTGTAPAESVRTANRRKRLGRLKDRLKQHKEKQAHPRQIFKSFRNQLKGASNKANEPAIPAAPRQRGKTLSFLKAAVELIDFPGNPKEGLTPNLPLPSTHEQPDSDQFLGSLTVLTYNVWTVQCLRHVHRQIIGIRMQNPDVICLQEVFHTPVFNAFRNEFDDYECVAFGRCYTPMATFVFLLGLFLWSFLWFALVQWILSYIFSFPQWFSYVLFVATVITVHLCTRNHYFIAFLLGNLTGMVLLVRKSLLDGQTNEKIMFSYPDGLEDDFLNGLRPRGFLSVVGNLLLKGGKSIRLRVANTHLNQPPEQQPGRGRYQQVIEIMKHCLGEDEVFIIAGDFNATPPGTTFGTSCETYSQVSDYLSDAWTSMNGVGDPNKDGLTWDQETNPMCSSAMNSIFYGHKMCWRCDYIFWRNSYDIASADVRVNLRSCQLTLTGEHAASDHFAVMAVYDFFEA